MQERTESCPAELVFLLTVTERSALAGIINTQEDAELEDVISGQWTREGQ